MPPLDHRLRRLLLGVVSLPCVLAAGCLGGYVYPTLHCIPSTPVGKPATDEVHAFRVDILDYTGCYDLSSTDEYRFRELALNNHGAVPTQVSAKFGGGWWGYFQSVLYHQRLHPTLRVRLYRPGFDTVELKPWEWKGIVAWHAATTPDAQEKAVDDLISTRETNDIYQLNPEALDGVTIDYSLGIPKTASQQAALDFISGEYERLATIALARLDVSTAARLQEKARQVRELSTLKSREKGKRIS